MANKINITIFSKDRPLQLFATLESLHKRCHDLECADISVINSLSEPYLDAYLEVRRYYPKVNFINETNFYIEIFKQVRRPCNYITFLVDDIIFTRDFSFQNAFNILGNVPDILCFSLRLGLGMDYSYSVNQKQRIPSFLSKEGSGHLIWEYRGCDADWGYPMSLDGHIFKIEDFTHIFSSIPVFYSPNSMEAAMSLFKHPKPFMAAFSKSVLFNFPANRVQDEFKNRNQMIAPETFLEKWGQGLKFDIEKCYNLNNNSCHFPVCMEFKKR